MNSAEGRSPGVTTMEAPRPTENLPPVAPQELLAPDAQADLATLESADNQTPNGIETALTLYSQPTPEATPPPVDNNVIDAEYTVVNPGEAADAGQPPVEEMPVDYVAFQQQVNAEIDRQAAQNPGKTRAEIENNAYDRLVYQFPDNAAELAAQGNKPAAEALKRRDELVRANQTRTEAQARPRPETQQGQAEVARKELADMSITEMAREAQKQIQNADLVIDELKDVTPEVKNTLKNANALSALLLLLLLTTLADMDVKKIEAVGLTMKARLEEKEKKKAEKDKKRAELEDKGKPKALEDKTPEISAEKAAMVLYKLVVPQENAPATKLPEPIMNEARLLTDQSTELQPMTFAPRTGSPSPLPQTAQSLATTSSAAPTT